MIFKHLLLGLGGSVAVGGIGYGIYASSQSNEKESTENVKNLENLNSLERGSDSTNPSGGQSEDSEQLEDQEKDSGKSGSKVGEEDTTKQAGNNNGTETSNPVSISGDTNIKSETSPEGAKTQS